MVRADAMPALENVALWHERDISHSSVERVIGPDATITLDFALARLTGVIDKLLVYPENMQTNLDRLGGPGPFAAGAAGADPGRASAARTPIALVQRNAMKVWQRRADFLTAAQGRSRGHGPSRRAELAALFDLGYHFKHVDTIFDRVFGSNPEAATITTSSSTADTANTRSAGR